MARTRFIEHKGRQILMLDFSGIVEPEVAIAAVEEAKRIVAQQPKQATLLTLTYVTDAHFNTEVIKAIRELVEHNRPYVKAGAVVGLAGLMKVVFTTLLHLTGRNLRAFDDLDAAKDYLVEGT